MVRQIKLADMAAEKMERAGRILMELVDLAVLRLEFQIHRGRRRPNLLVQQANPMPMVGLGLAETG